MSEPGTHCANTDDAIQTIRELIAEENMDDFSNDDLLDACIELVRCDDAARTDEIARSHPKDDRLRDGNPLASTTPRE